MEDSQDWEWISQGIEQPPPPYALQCFGLSIASPTATRVFLGCSTGLYYSDDYGGQWHSITLPWTEKAVEELEAASDGSVYVRIYNNHSIFRIESGFAETTFLVSKNGFPGPIKSPGVVAPNPSDPNELLVITGQPEEKVYYSHDRGENWSTPSGGTIPVEPLRPAWLWDEPTVISHYSVYQLNAMGESWSTLWTRQIGDQYRVLEAGEDTLLMGDTLRGVWRSENRGAAWAFSSQGMSAWGQVFAIAPHPTNPDILAVGLGGHGVWVTEDDGATWAGRTTGFEVDPAYNITIRALAIDPANSNLWVAGVETSSGLPAPIYTSSDAGAHWNKVTDGPTGLTFCFYFVKKTPGIILAGTGGDGIWRSPDHGATWTRVAEAATFRNVLDFVEETGGRLFAALIGGFNPTNGYGTSDSGGTSWTAIEDTASSSLAADPSQPGRVMLGTGWWDAGAGMRYTSDNGTVWNPVNNGLPTRVYGYDVSRSTLADPSHSGTYFTLLENSGVFKTANNGDLWTQIGTVTEGRVLEFSSRNQGTLFLGGSSHGLLYTQLVQALPTLTPTLTATIQAPPTSTPTTQGTPTFTPPPGFPPNPTPTPTPAESVNAGVVDETFWFSPVAPTVDSFIQAGVSAFNNSTANLDDVKVDFYWGTSTTSMTHLSTVTIAHLPARTRVQIQSSVGMTPPSAGTYYLKAVLDELDVIAEYDETDNVAMTAFYARQPGADTVPPTGSIEIAGGSLFTQNDDVSVHFNASDSGSGVAYMYVTAWVYDPSRGDWAPYYDSGWVDYFADASFILSGANFEALSVTYADLDENVSDTYWAVINYYPVEFTEFVWYDEWNIYPMYLPAGANVNLTIQMVLGDADLYVAAPSTPDGYYDWADVKEGGSSETVSFTAPEEGVYWAYVYGYDFSEFYFLCSGSKGTLPADMKRAPHLKPARRGPDLIHPRMAGERLQNVGIPALGVDFTGDGAVNYRDLFYLAKRWGKVPGDTGYDARIGGADMTRPIGGKHLLEWLRMRR
jgi:hypothetical protein